MVAGESYNGSAYTFALVRCNNDGTLDNTFSSDGKVTTAIGSSDAEGVSIVIQSDGSPMSTQIARRVVESFQQRKSNAMEIDQLNTREWEILSLLDKGFRYKEISDQLTLSFETVRTYVRNIYDKLQVHSRTDALNKVFPKQ